MCQPGEGVLLGEGCEMHILGKKKEVKKDKMALNSPLRMLLFAVDSASVPRTALGEAAMLLAWRSFDIFFETLGENVRNCPLQQISFLSFFGLPLPINR